MIKISCPKKLGIFATGVVLASCSSAGLRRYESFLESRVGKVERPSIDKELGEPTHCDPPVQGRILCEYRTSYGRNNPVPSVFTKKEGFGPDLSPYDSFDVLHLYYDELGVLRDWEGVVIR